jgi:DNA-binding response OmpR family regulator
MGQYHPTLLVITEDSEFRRTLVRLLQQEGYLVLEADDNDTALHIARLHSRPIHFVLIHACMNHGVLASMLKQYRRESTILLVTEHNNERLSDDVSTPDTVLPKLRAFFSDSSERAMHG